MASAAVFSGCIFAWKTCFACLLAGHLSTSSLLLFFCAITIFSSAYFFEATRLPVDCSTASRTNACAALTKPKSAASRRVTGRQKTPSEASAAALAHPAVEAVTSAGRVSCAAVPDPATMGGQPALVTSAAAACCARHLSTGRAYSSDE